VHSACADFHIVGLLKHATLRSPKTARAAKSILEIEALGFFSKFYLVFKCSPRDRGSGAGARGGARSKVSAASRNSLTPAAWPLYSMRSQPLACETLREIPRLDVQRLHSEAAALLARGRTGARRKKPASRRMVCHKQRSGRTSAASRPALTVQKATIAQRQVPNRRCRSTSRLPADHRNMGSEISVLRQNHSEISTDQPASPC